MTYHVPVGISNGLLVSVAPEVIAQEGGVKEVRRKLGMARCYPVYTSLGGGKVMVEADSQEEAISKYLRAKQGGI